MKGPLLPPRVIYSETGNLYYFGDKLYIPNDPELIDSVIYEFHETNGHPNYVRTLTNLSQLFCCKDYYYDSSTTTSDNQYNPLPTIPMTSAR